MNGSNALLTAALDYAARGWRVVPLHQVDPTGTCSCGSPDCKSPGKHPRTKSGLKDATTDGEQIRRWWGIWPRANVAVVCGKASGIWMVGPDGEQGLADLAELEKQHGELPPTLRSRSGGGGGHLIFRWPADGEFITNRKNHRGTKIDVRAEGEMGCGYFVAPPSRTDKGEYAWTSQDEPAEPTAWVVEWARRNEERPTAAPAPARPIPMPANQDREQVHRRAKAYLEKCPEGVMNQRGSDPTFWAARVLVHGFCLDQSEAYALIATFFNPKCVPPWSEKELRHKVKEAAERPFNKERGWLLNAADPSRDMPWQNSPAAGQAAAQAPPTPTAKPWELRPSNGSGIGPGVSASDLFTREFEPIRFAVGDLLPEGLTVLAGKPKGGKSYFTLQLGWAVAAGQPFSGRPTVQGDVLYLAVEDTERRMATRLRQLRPSMGYDPPAALTVHVRWPRADQGGLYHIAEWLEAHKKTARLVMIDTLAKFRTPGKANGNSYAEDYEAVGAFKELLDHYAVSGLIVHHTRKQKAEDPFDEISGTTAISGAADSMWVLERERGQADGRLFITGRDIAEGTVPMKCDPATRHWTLGERVEGIDTNGRTTDVARSGSQLDECTTWLRKFLADYAFPVKEIDKAGKAKGFSFPTIKEAKTRLGQQGTGEMSFRKFGRGEWWFGVGPPDDWKLRPLGSSELPNFQSEPRYRKDTGEGETDEDEDGGF